MSAPNKTELAALGLVNRESMHGYRLNRIVQGLHLEQWENLSPSSIYNSLGRLAKQGAVSTTLEREGKAPERTVYHITPKGREALVELLRQALVYVGPKDRLFYLGLTFAESLRTDEIVALLEARREILLHTECTPDEDGVSINEEPHPPHSAILRAAGRRHMHVEADLCGELIDLFGAEPGYFEKFKGENRDE